MPIPAGVPVAIMSPSSKVIMLEINSIRNGTSKIILLIFESCLILPLTLDIIKASPRLILLGSTIYGPMGANVSKLFALVHWLSIFWRSRAVTSLKQVNPSITSFAFLPEHFYSVYRSPQQVQLHNPTPGCLVDVQYYPLPL